MVHIHSDCPANGEKKALLIAVEDVKNFPKLYRAQGDAKELRRLLIEDFGYPEGNIVLMMDHDSVPKVLWPTRMNIIKQLQLFVQGVSAGDHLFFYYSGHASQVPCDHHTEPDGLDEGIHTCSGKEIMDNDLKKWLVDPLPRGCKLFALCDSCHSQTILDLEHYICNEPRVRQHMRHRESSPPLTFWRVVPRHFCRKGIPPIPRRTFTTAPYELRGRPASRAPVSISAVSAGSSPPFSKWIPFSVEVIQRVLSPSSLFECNGKCSLPTEGDTSFAHVISLSACKDNEKAVDDYCNGTFTKFFIDHMSKLLNTYAATVSLSFIQGENPKSTLKELLLATRKHVGEITAARRAWDVQTRAISRQATFATGPRIKVKAAWTPRCLRRNTEVNFPTLGEFLRLKSSGVQEDANKYSQQPSYSSHYPLNLDELVDL